MSPVELPARTLLLFVLSVIGGSTDTISFLALNGLFTAHITGNLVILAAHVVAGDPAVLSYIFAVPVFIGVLWLSSLAARRLERRDIPALRPLMFAELLLLSLFLMLCVSSGAAFESQSALALVTGMCGVAAMAVQTAMVQTSLANAPSTAVMTSNVAQLVVALAELPAGRDPAAADQARQRIARLLPVIMGFVLGCALGAAGDAAWGVWSLAVPTALAALAFALSSSPAVRS